MAGLVESFVFRMVVDNQQFKKGLSESNKALQSTDKQVKETQGLLKQTSTAFLGVAAVRSAVGLLRDATDASANLANVKATAEQVFGDAADAIMEWAKTSVTALGLSERAAIQGATTIAALGKSAGLAGDDLVAFSKEMVQYATDLSQLYNTDVQQAIDAIQSGFSGSSIEPLRKYNIILSDTILKDEYRLITGEKITGVLTQQQRMIAFISRFQKEAADSVGQWGREYDGALAAQQRLSASLENLKADIGDAIVGPVAIATSALAGFATVLGTVAEVTGPIGPALLATAVAMKVLGPALAIGVKAFQAITTAMQLGTLAITPYMTVILAAAAAITAVFSVMADEAREADLVADGLERIAKQGASVAVALDEMTKPRSDWDWESYMPWAQDDWERVDPEEVINQFKTLAEESPKMAAKVLDAMTATEEGRQAVQAFSIDTERMKRILNDTIRTQAEQAAAQRDWSEVLAESTGMIERNETAWQDYRAEIEKLEGASDEARGALKDLLDQATTEFTSDLDPYIAKQKLLVDQIALAALTKEKPEDATEAAQQQYDILQARKGILEDIYGIVDATTASLADQNGKALEGQALYEAQLAALAQVKVEHPELAAEVDAAIAEIEQQQPGIDVALHTLEDGTFAASVEAAIASIGAPALAVDMLVDSGMSEEDANAVVASLPDEKLVKLIADSTELATSLGLDDDKALELTVNAITTTAEDDINDMLDTAWQTNVAVDANVGDADRAIRKWRLEQSTTPVVIPVTAGPAPSSTTPSAAPSNVRAGSPVTVNVHLPSAARPQEVVTAIQTWVRRNGRFDAAVN